MVYGISYNVYEWFKMFFNGCISQWISMNYLFAFMNGHFHEWLC